MKYKILLIIFWGALFVTIIFSIIDSIKINKMKSAAKSTIYSGPIQEIKEGLGSIELNGARIDKIAKYDITGLIIGKEVYYGKNAYKISNYDLTLAWGIAAQHSDDIKVISILNDRQVEYKLSGKLYSKYGDNATHYISNNHLIPVNSTVKRLLKKAKIGKVIQMTGYLVYCEGDNWTWGPSSTSRTDTGCEIILVETVNYL